MPLNRLPDYISSNISLTGVSADYLDGIDSLTLSSSLRANKSITGGGTITFDASANLSWTQRFIIISNGRGPFFSTVGYYDIDMPPVGTVITGVGGSANKTVSASGISINVWEALYYILPIGGIQTGLPSNFRIALYTSDLEVPHNWVLIAVRNGDNGYMYLNNGIVLKLGQKSISGLNVPIINNYSIGLGTSALNAVTNGDGNVAIGHNALLVNTSGSSNIAIGWNALDQNVNGGDNIAIGYEALSKNVSTGYNIGIGTTALNNNVGSNNTALGGEVMYANTSGSDNTGIGYYALGSNTTGIDNTALGSRAGDNLTTGSNNIVIGRNADASSVSVSNEITLGNSSITRFRIPGLDIDWFGAFSEKATVSATASTGTINYDFLTNRNVLYYTSNATGNWTLNIRGNSTNTLNSLLSTGQSLTVVFMNTNGTTAYYPTAFQIDGTAVTPKWANGTAPSAGNANSIDVYTYNIIKTASATYTVLASQSRFA